MAISLGAGVNSIAMTVMLAEDGWRGDILFADTGCEWPETYCYLRYFEDEYLRPRGLNVTRLKGLPWQRQSGGISLIEHCQKYAVIPFAAARWCTTQWKVLPLSRWAKEHGNPEYLIGIAADEARRRPDAIRPLVDAGVTRAGCIEIIQAAGLEVPQKSGCYICPFQGPAQWRLLWERHPGLFEQAARLEELASARTGKPIMLDPSGSITLRQRKMMYEGQMPMFNEQTMDELLAYRPCICGL